MKKILLIVKFILAIIFLSPLSVSADTGEAAKFIEDVSSKALGIINESGLDRQAKTDKLRELLDYAIDIDWISKFVLGSHYNKLSEEQKKRYIVIYKDYILNSYVPKFEEYNQNKVAVNPAASTQTRKNDYLVKTQIISPDNQKIDVDYKLRKSGNNFKIYDVIAERVSMITTQRSEFGSLITRNDVDFFLEKLEQKSKNLADKK